MFNARKAAGNVGEVGRPTSVRDCDAHDGATEEMLRFLSGRGRMPVEGSSPPQQQNYLRSLARQLHARMVGEVGFNAGFSSLAFLGADPKVKVVSFDIGDHDVIRDAKAFIDLRYPGRHELVIGDSKLTLSRYKERHPDVFFDLVFIDGGHDLKTARSDIASFRLLCQPGADVVIDDLMPWRPFGVGPTKAWNEAISQGTIVPIEILKDGQRVGVVRPPADRAWGRGRYREHSVPS